MGEIWLNGRILGRPVGGVRRYATEIAAHLDCRVAVPPSARTVLSGRVWEQTTLAAHARHDVVLSVAHSAPLIHPRSVVVVHDLFALDRPHEVSPWFATLMRQQLPVVVRRAAGVATHCREVADQVQERFGVADVTVAPPGISEVFAPGARSEARVDLRLGEERPVVGAFIDTAPRKQPRRLLQALEEVERLTGAQVVVGRRSGAAAFAASVDDRVGPLRIPAGWVEVVDPADAELATLYRACDVVVCGSDAEGWGLHPVEAAACGVAVVSPAIPSVLAAAGAIDTAEADAEALATNAAALLADDDRRRDLANRGAQLRREMTWADTASVLGDLCHQVAGATPTPRRAPRRHRRALPILGSGRWDSLGR